MLDGAAKVKPMVQAAVEDGQPALALTDHGNLYGIIEHYQACREAGIKPIPGCELYYDGESRFNRKQAKRGQKDVLGGLDVAETGKTKDRYHQIVLAYNTIGYKNLVALASEAYLTGYYGKPRADWELLDRYHEGLAITTSCLGGMVPQALMAGEYEAALKLADRMQQIVGPDNLYVELQDHGIPEQHRIMPDLLRIAKQLGAPLLAANDSHFIHEDDHDSHDVLLCVQTGAQRTDEKRFKFSGSGHWLRSAAQMRELFRDYPEACDNTLALAERVDVDIEHGLEMLPHFEVPDQFKDAPDPQAAYLRHLVMDGARRRYGDLSTVVTDRIDYELRVIGEMGFSSYFLIVWDLVRFARSQGIRMGPGRGSAAGAVTAYALNISQLDPIRFGLLFERFLNPGRRQMPDIDMDFDEARRLEVIQYAARKYGTESVAQIITFTQIKSRAAVKDSARVLGHSYTFGDKITKALPPLIMGRDTPLSVCLSETPLPDEGYRRGETLRDMVRSDPQVKQVTEVAKRLEGLIRSDGIHASAVVIADRPLHQIIPVQRKPKPTQDPAEAPLLTQYEMHAVEWIGLLKMDFLGIRNLSVMERTVNMVRELSGEEIDLDNLPLDDQPTFDLISAGDTTGVFQLESSQIRHLCQALVPDSFEDIGALIALYRPGPMGSNMHTDYADRKNGRQVGHKPMHPSVADVLAPTHNLMIYQEQLMQVAQKMAGFSLIEADNLRKACGKKDPALLAAQKDRFVAGCLAQGHSQKDAEKVFDIIVPFSNYAFNKSHAYCYGMVTYQTAWLKVHWPAHYMAALLTSVSGDAARLEYYMAECRRMGITIRVPDINLARQDFSVARNDQGTYEIVFGLTGIKGLGEAIINQLVQVRGDRPFQDFYDFAERTCHLSLSSNVLAALIDAGSFDGFRHPRRGLSQVAGDIYKKAAEGAKREQQGVQLLFEVNTRIPIPRSEWPQRTKQNRERAVLSFYVSSHPLDDMGPALQRRCSHDMAEVLANASAYNGQQITMGGIVTNREEKITKNGNRMGRFHLAGLNGTLEAVVFPQYWVAAAHQAKSGEVVIVTGELRIEDEDATPQFMVQVVEKFTTSDGPVVRIDLPSASDHNIATVRDAIAQHPGNSPVYLVIAGRDAPVRLPPRMDCDASEAFMRAVLERLQ